MRKLSPRDNRVFLSVCDRPLSGSINRILNASSSYHVEIINLNPDELPNLDAILDNLVEFKDDPDLKGIILTDILKFNEKNPSFENSGVDLIKHIRLTDALGSLCSLPIILFSYEEIMQHLKTKRDNILLISPGCYPIQLPFYIDKLLSTVENLKYFESPEEMRNEIKNFLVWSEEDEIVSHHDNFNKYGPFKLLKEHYGSVPELLSKDYEKMTQKIWFKKYQFLKTSQIIPSCSQEFDKIDLKKVVSNKKVLYIDDEHRLGWSYALYSLIFEDLNEEIYDLFQSSDPFIKTQSGKFACIDNYDEAIRLFEAYNNELTKTLSEYSDAEQSKKKLSEQFNIVQKSLNNKGNEFEATRKSYDRYDSEIKKTEKRIEEIKNHLSEKTIDDLSSLAEDFVDEKIGITEFTNTLGEIKELSDEFIRESQKLKQDKTVFKEIDNRIRKLQEKFEQTQNEYEKIKMAKFDAERRFAATCNRLCPFEFDLILLDLRLKRDKDKGSPPQKISGIELLYQIKKFDPSIPVIMITASEKALNYKEALDLGASGYWIKVVNSASNLNSEIDRALGKFKEIQKLWLEIKKVEAKKQLIYFFETSSNAPHLERGIMSNVQKNNIISLLRESFLLFQRELLPYEKSICNYTNYAKIALNMGLVQEIRLKDIKSKRYYNWVTKRKIPQDEIAIHDIRNKAAHDATTNISYEEALGVFKKTIERCLMY